MPGLRASQAWAPLPLGSPVPFPGAAEGGGHNARLGALPWTGTATWVPTWGVCVKMERAGLGGRSVLMEQRNTASAGRGREEKPHRHSFPCRAASHQLLLSSGGNGAPLDLND